MFPPPMIFALAAMNSSGVLNAAVSLSAFSSAVNRRTIRASALSIKPPARIAVVCAGSAVRQ